MTYFVEVLDARDQHSPEPWSAVTESETMADAIEALADYVGRYLDTMPILCGRVLASNGGNRNGREVYRSNYR